MITCLDETNSKLYFPLPEKFTIKLPDRFREETFIGEFGEYYRVLTETSSILTEAWNATRTFKNKHLALEAQRLLVSFRKLVTDVHLLDFTLGTFPPLIATEVNENSVLVEWIFESFRIGFSIESCEADSSWYLVSDKSMGNANASGYLFDFESPQLRYIILLLLCFVLTNN